MSYTQTGDTVFSTALNTWVSTSSLAHAYTFNGDGTLATDTCTDGTNSWRKTYGYTSGVIASETGWVKQ